LFFYYEEKYRHKRFKKMEERLKSEINDGNRNVYTGNRNEILGK
jgi:hypothetical protein